MQETPYATGYYTNSIYISNDYLMLLSWSISIILLSQGGFIDFGRFTNHRSFETSSKPIDYIQVTLPELY